MGMEQMPMPRQEAKVEKNKVEGLFTTIETLMRLSGEDAKKFAALTFCEMILKNLPSENEEVIELKARIAETRESAKGNENPDTDKLQETIGQVKELYERLKEK